MRYQTCFSYIASFTVLASLLCGCASVGTDFKYQNAESLELGQLRSSDYQAMFGKTKSIEVKDAPEGKFELVTYLYASAGVGYAARSRGLNLEFRDGVLNSYTYLNSFEETTINAERLNEIKPGVSKKEDVLRILGKPAGKGLCPSYSAFKEVCDKGHEIWIWMVVGRGVNAKTQGMMVAFDKDGVVTATEAALK